MRVEVVYAPGCSSYQKAISILETVIAEERLPIPIERVEDAYHGAPSIRVDGVSHSSVGQHVDNLRDILSCKWKELNEHQLLGL